MSTTAHSPPNLHGEALLPSNTLECRSSKAVVGGKTKPTDISDPHTTQTLRRFVFLREATHSPAHPHSYRPCLWGIWQLVRRGCCVITCSPAKMRVVSVLPTKSLQHSKEAALAKETCAQTLMTRGQASEALGFYKVCVGKYIRTGAPSKTCAACLR